MRISEEVASLLWMLVASALVAVFVVALIDPACGPSGHEQTQWINELFSDTSTEAK